MRVSNVIDHRRRRDGLRHRPAPAPGGRARHGARALHPGRRGLERRGGHPRPADGVRGPRALPGPVPAQPRPYPAFAAELLELTGVNVAYLPMRRARGRLRRGPAAPPGGAPWRGSARWACARSCSRRRGARGSSPSSRPQVLAAAHFPDDHQVDNRLLVRALTDGRRAAGAHVPQRLRARAWSDERAGGRRGPGRRGAARGRVVVRRQARGPGWCRALPLDPRAVRPARGQMVQLQTPTAARAAHPRVAGGLPGAARGWRGHRRQHHGDGGLRQAGHRGGAAHASSRMALELCPALAAAPGGRDLGRASGPAPRTSCPFSVAGPVPGLFLATGHFRNGILLRPSPRAYRRRSVSERAAHAWTCAPFRYRRGPTARLPIAGTTSTVWAGSGPVSCRRNCALPRRFAATPGP